MGLRREYLMTALTAKVRDADKVVLDKAETETGC
jgi:hypothetical protein